MSGRFIHVARKPPEHVCPLPYAKAVLQMYGEGTLWQHEECGRAWELVVPMEDHRPCWVRASRRKVRRALRRR